MNLQGILGNRKSFGNHNLRIYTLSPKKSQSFNRRLRLPGDRHLLVADRQDDLALADQGDDGFAAIAHLAVGQHRLDL